MVTHVVMWTLKDNALGNSKADNLAKFREMLLGLPALIPQIRQCEVGLMAFPTPGAFDLVLITRFDNEDDLAIYQNHPAHVVVKQFAAEVHEKRALVDYIG